MLTFEFKKLPGSLWFRSMIPLICMEGGRSPCENHYRISLISFVSNVLPDVIVQRFSTTFDECRCENHADCRPCRFVEQIFSLLVFLKPVISILSDLKLVVSQFFGAASHWMVGHENSFYFSNLDIGAAEAEFVHKPVFSASSPWEVIIVMVFPFSPLLFNYVLEMIITITLCSCENGAICLARNLSYGELAVGAVPLCEDPSKFQVFPIV